MKVADGVPSLQTKILSFSFFLTLTVSALAWFCHSAYTLLSQSNQNAPIVAFDKGSMYMLGIGLVLLLLTTNGVMHGILGKELTEKVASSYKYGIVASLILMVVLPQLTHFIVNRHFKNADYVVCNEVSYRWMLYSKYYYTGNQAICSNIVREKKNKAHGRR